MLYLGPDPFIAYVDPAEASSPQSRSRCLKTHDAREKLAKVIA